VGPVLNILSRSRNLTTASQSVSPGATETIAMSPAANITGYGYNNVNALTGVSPGGNAYFQGTTNKAVKSVTVGSVPATLDSTRDFSVSAPLSQGQNDVPVTAIDGGNNSKTENFQIKVRGQQSAALTFDANGNMTSNGTGQTFEWDAENRLIKVTYPGTGNYSSFKHDSYGRNIEILEYVSSSLDSTHKYIYAEDRRSERRNVSGGVEIQYFDYGQSNLGNSYFYSGDHLDSLTELTTSSGSISNDLRYDSFGQATAIQEALDPEIGFAGYFEHSRSNLNLTRHRPYSSKLGRWLNRDLLGEAMGPNAFAYVLNDPVSNSDPSGLRPEAPAPGPTAPPAPAPAPTPAPSPGGGGGGSGTGTATGAVIIIVVAGVIIVLVVAASRGYKGWPRDDRKGRPAEEPMMRCKYANSVDKCDRCCSERAERMMYECDSKWGPSGDDYDPCKHRCCYAWVVQYLAACKRRCSGGKSWKQPTDSPENCP